MSLLTKLVEQLPFLKPHESWSGQWLSDTPLRKALVRSNSAEEGIINPATIPIRLLVSDIIQWFPAGNIYHNAIAFDLPRTNFLKQVYRQIQQNNSGLGWSSSLVKYMPETQDAYMVPPRASSTPEPQVYAGWVPDCKHWEVQMSRCYYKPIRLLTNGEFRLYILLKQRRKKFSHRMVTTSGRIHIPYAVPENYMLPSLWKMFWALPLPHKVVTVWWRLLQGKIGYQSTLFRWSSSLWSSSICRICRSEIETASHFFVSCFRKWPLWQEALNELSLNESFSTPESIWTAIYTLHDQKGNIVPEDTLVSLSVILESLWCQHWRCIFDDEPWSQLACMSAYSASVSKMIVDAATLPQDMNGD
jgi:hypothetical protein